jgi:hypothetical protein
MAFACGLFFRALAEEHHALLGIISGQAFRGGCAVAGAKAQFFFSILRPD